MAMAPPVTGHVVRFIEGGRPPPIVVSEARGKEKGMQMREYE